MGSILRKKKKDNYTSFDNSFLLDNSITYAAKGLAISLLMKPEDWIISQAAIINESNLGRDKVKTLLKELIDSGYMYKSNEKRNTGRFSQNIFYISDEKEYLKSEIIDKELGLPVTGKPSTVNPSMDKKDIRLPVTEKPSTVNPLWNNNPKNGNSFTVTDLPSTVNPPLLNTSSSSLTTTTKYNNNLDIILGIFKEYKISDATVKNIFNLKAEFTEDRIKIVLEHCKNNNLGEGALYKAFKENWHISTASPGNSNSTVSDDQVERILKSRYEHYAYLLENYSFSNEEVIQKFYNETEKYKGTMAYTEHYNKYCKLLSNVKSTEFNFSDEDVKLGKDIFKKIS